MNEEKAFRNVVRQIVKQELDEATTTAAVPGYQTPFAFGSKDDEKREDDIEDFLDTYGWKMAELAKKALDEELSDSEERRLEQYIGQIQALRGGGVEEYREKSNYLPHNLEENLRGAIRTEAKRVLTEGARMGMRYYDGDLSKRDLKKAWSDFQSRTRAPRDPYDKTIGNFGIKVVDREFSDYDEAMGYIQQNSSKRDDLALAVKVREVGDTTNFRAPDMEGSFWMVGKWIRE